VDERSAPAFIVHTAKDALVHVKNSLLFAGAYADENIPFELHVYPEGPHGMALANEITKTNNDAFIDDAFAKWVEQAVRWTKRIK
jgi:dipeptidyl aminopeptidase/acylaminoacyl peptidase